MIEYDLFHPLFVKNKLTNKNRFVLDIGCLSEHNRRENERIEKEEKERKQKENMPGVTRMVSAEERSAQLKAMRKEKEI